MDTVTMREREARFDLAPAHPDGNGKQRDQSLVAAIGIGSHGARRSGRSVSSTTDSGALPTVSRSPFFVTLTSPKTSCTTPFLTLWGAAGRDSRTDPVAGWLLNLVHRRALHEQKRPDSLRPVEPIA